MTAEFFEQSRKVREAIREKISQELRNLSDRKLKDISLQRNATSSFLKGVLAYYVHEGVGGAFSDKERVALAAALEIFCSAGAILDNAIDGHEERNGRTTYLREYGTSIQIAASQYVLHKGFQLLLPFLPDYCHSHAGRYRVGEAVIAMVQLDLERTRSAEDHIRVLEQSNGIFAEIPLVMAAVTGTDDEQLIGDVAQYGFKLGTCLAIYEELRDLCGDHGRRRGTEIEAGRVILPIHLAMQRSSAVEPRSYLGKRMSDAQYQSLFNWLVDTKAIDRAIETAHSYLDAADAALERAVTSECRSKLLPLSSEIRQSLMAIPRAVNRG